MVDTGFDLRDRRVLVTGGSTGIGAAIAARLADLADRAGLPEEIAGMVHYLVAPIGRFANGSTYTVDGGALTLGPFDTMHR